MKEDHFLNNLVDGGKEIGQERVKKNFHKETNGGEEMDGEEEEEVEGEMDGREPMMMGITLGHQGLTK